MSLAYAIGMGRPEQAGWAWGYQTTWRKSCLLDWVSDSLSHALAPLSVLTGWWVAVLVGRDQWEKAGSREVGSGSKSQGIVAFSCPKWPQLLWVWIMDVKNEGLGETQSWDRVLASHAMDMCIWKLLRLSKHQFVQFPHPSDTSDNRIHLDVGLGSKRD